MRQLKNLLGLRWIYLTSFTFFIVEAVPLTERKVRQVDVCKEGCQPGYQIDLDCCNGRISCTETAFCEKCKDGLYLHGEGKDAFCDTCIVCQLNEVELQKCTKESNAICECQANYYRSSSQRCVKCPDCTEADCPADCSPITTTTQSSPITTTEHSNTGNTSPDLPHPTNLTTPTNVREMTSSTMSSTVLDAKPENESLWKPKVYVPLMVFSPVFFLAIVGFATRVLCCWTEKSKTFWTHYFPCFLRYGCCKPNEDPSPISSSAGNENNGKKKAITNILCCSCNSQQNDNQDNRPNHNGSGNEHTQSDTNGNNDVFAQNEESIPLPAISSSNEQNADVADSIPNPEAQPLINHQDTNNSASGSNVKNSASNVMKLHPPPKSRRRLSSSSLSPVPENAEVKSTASDNHNQPIFVLPEWCFRDANRVTQQQISVLSQKIGNKGILIGGQLDLPKGELENIEHGHKSDLARQNYEILSLWLDKRGVGATKKLLAKALDNVGRGQEATHLWPDRELKPVTPTTPQNEVYLWRRRLSNETNFRIDTSAIAKMDWSQLRTWKTIIKDIRDNDHGSFKQLCVACGAVEIKCPEFESLKKCQSLRDNSHLEIDEYSNTLMNPDLQTLTAITIAQDGDCLFSAASIIAFGTADHCCELRLRTVIELCAHKDYYLYKQSLRESIEAEYALTKVEDDKKLSYKAIEGIYEGCVRETLKENLPFSLHGNSIQLFGLASVLGCKIQAVYPTNKQSPLHILIPPRDLSIENPITVYVMWSRHTQLSEGESFYPNHFVPLLKK